VELHVWLILSEPVDAFDLEVYPLAFFGLPSGPAEDRVMNSPSTLLPSLLLFLPAAMSAPGAAIPARAMRGPILFWCGDVFLRLYQGSSPTACFCLNPGTFKFPFPVPAGALLVYT